MNVLITCCRCGCTALGEEWIDGFDSDETYTSGTHDSQTTPSLCYDVSDFGGSPATTWTVSSGVLSHSAVHGNWSLCCACHEAIPDLEGLRITISAIYDWGSESFGTAIIVNFGPDDITRHVRLTAGANLVSLQWIVDAGVGGFQNFSVPSAASGQELKMVITDASSGAGTFDVECFLNGVSVGTKTGLTWTDPPALFGSDFQFGILAEPWGTDGTVDDLYFLAEYP